MKHRREQRIPKVLRVKVRGVDRNGNSFVQKAHTIDISRCGARLDSLGCLRGPGETIQVQRGWKKAGFRVVWTGQIGLPEQDQVGIRCLEPSNYIWGVALPPPRSDNYRIPRQEAPETEAAPQAWAVPPSTGIERSTGKRRSLRRSMRLDLQVAVGVRWITSDGTPQEKDAATLVVNDYGCLVPLKAAMIEGMNLELVNRTNKEVRRGKVIWCGAVNLEGRHEVGIELEEPDPQFWGPQYAKAMLTQNLSDSWIG